MFDMQDLAEGADTRVPEVLDLVERGVYSSEVHFLLYLTRGRATNVRSALQASLRRTNGVVQQRVRAALEAVERGMAERTRVARG